MRIWTALLNKNDIIRLYSQLYDIRSFVFYSSAATNLGDREQTPWEFDRHRLRQHHVHPAPHQYSFFVLLSSSFSAFIPFRSEVTRILIGCAILLSRMLKLRLSNPHLAYQATVVSRFWPLIIDFKTKKTFYGTTILGEISLLRTISLYSTYQTLSKYFTFFLAKFFIYILYIIL